MALLDTPICDFGWKAPNFDLKDPNGTAFNLKGSMGENGLLVAFLCNHCPYVKTLATRLGDDARALREIGVNVVGIMSNDYRDYPEDNPENMLRFAKSSGWDFPYLVDEDQSVGTSYGAVCTPDFFGFNRDAELQYRGRLDDGTIGRDATRRELYKAMKQVSKTGQGPGMQTPSMGCSIKWS